MSTLIVAALSFVGFIVAYHTYGRWLGRKIFGLDPAAITPAQEFNDGTDFVPTRRSVLFGHHFTSIAGTGPIVGPAIAVFWGWLPALLWVVFGSIFIGAVHDFGALVLSLRNRGETIGQIAGRILSPRARFLLLLLLLLELMIVLAVFGLVIAAIFRLYHGGVLAVWASLPMAVGIGLWHYKRKGRLLVPALLAVAVIYVLIWVGIRYAPVDIMSLLYLEGVRNPYINATTVWTVILFIYCFVAAVLPVWLLLQPRDYINSNQLYVAMIAVVVGMFVAGVTGQTDLFSSAPAVAREIPADAPPIWPFLFITVACGAVSGFHSLVSSGTSSKQLAHENDAQFVGYGAMLLEGALAVIVILICCAGVGMGVYQKQRHPVTGAALYKPVTDKAGEPLTGRAAWREKYRCATVKDAEGNLRPGGWASMGLGDMLRAFAEGGANFLQVAKIPFHFAVDMLGVMAACFAATTLDTATRLQRYVLQELGHSIRVRPLQNKYVATGIAVVSAAALAILLKTPGGEYGSGGLILWPMFGAANQILAGLGFLVVAVWLIRRKRPIWFLVLPAVLMLVLPAWAMGDNMLQWWRGGKWLLLGFGGAIQLLTAWLVVEAVIAWRNARREGMV
ncbi:MAG: carbon starvation protein A [Phycisphaerae bacterium]|nr:carbon starvation protein A [Phycisphaerae bacterium]